MKAPSIALALYIPKRDKDPRMVDLSFVTVAEGKHGPIIRNPSDSASAIPPDPWGMTADLALNVWSAESGPGWQVSIAYVRPYLVDLARAERMHKALRSIAARHDKIRAVEGWPETVGRGIVQASRACGASLVVWEECAAMTYDAGAHTVKPIAECVPELSRRFAHQSATGAA